MYYEGWRKGDTDKDGGRERGDRRVGGMTINGERTKKREGRKMRYRRYKGVGDQKRGHRRKKEGNRERLG